MADLTFYHGTSSVSLPSIQEKGLIPEGGSGADAWAAKNYDVLGWTADPPKKREAAVYLASNPFVAAEYAVYAADITGGKPVVLKVDIPSELVVKLDNDARDWRAVICVLCQIPPANISVIAG